MRVRSLTHALAAAAIAVGCTGQPARTEAASHWQASIEPVVRLVVRDTSNAAFSADFALTSPKGTTHHARVASDGQGSVAVEFGNDPRVQPFAPLGGSFYPGMKGRWTWSCAVEGSTVARGGFTYDHDDAGNASVRLEEVKF